MALLICILIDPSICRLITFVAEGVRLRLDRIYLDSLQDARHAPQEHGGATGTIEIDKLQEEVETLYSEIGSVADMSIQQTYLHPLLRLIRGRDDSAVQESESTLEHVRVAFMVSAVRSSPRHTVTFLGPNSVAINQKAKSSLSRHLPPYNTCQPSLTS